MAVLVDWSQIVVMACTAFPEDFKIGAPENKMLDIARHSILSSLLNFKKNYGKYGEVIICCDGRNYWRKSAYKYYKANRKKKRDSDDTDWGAIFKLGDAIRADIMSTFPFRVVLEDEAEADDVIATLVKYYQDNELITLGLEESPQKAFVISSDGDFKQLYRYRNYAQWSPRTQSIVPKPEKTFLLEKVLIGDFGDNVPSVRSHDSIFEEGIRQKPVTAKMKEAFFANPSGDHLTEEEQKNLKRNRMLIDFDYIPQDITDKIIEKYQKSTRVIDKNAVYEYFIKHRCRILINQFEDFF